MSRGDLVARVGLVSCSSRKADSEQVARDLYCSTLFALSRAYAECVCDCWFILSAKYGLLTPATRVAPYDLTLNTMPTSDRRDWARRIGAALAEVTVSSDVVVMLAGNRYAEHLLPLLHVRGIHVERPLAGMGIGQQQRWLKGRINAGHA